MSFRYFLPFVVLVCSLPADVFAQAISPIAPGVGARSLVAKTQATAPGQGPCSLRTLKGTYSFNFEGTTKLGATGVRQSGSEVFDGQGHISAKLTTTIGDPFSQNQVQSKKIFTLNYTVSPDCSGTLSDENGPYADLFIDPTGDAFHFIFTVPGTLVSGETRRISRQVLPLDP